MPGLGRRPALSAALLLADGPAAAQAARPLGLRDALRTWLPLMVIVFPFHRRPSGDEVIGGWAHFLNEALRDRPAEVTATRARRAMFRDVFAAPALRQDHATLFVRPDRAALLHECPVLDPPVYEAGFAFLRDGAAPPADGGLVPVQAGPR